MKVKSNKRTLKVYPKYRFKKVLFTYKSPQIITEILPEIRLIGKWLQQSGFSPGDTISVEIKKDKIVIKKSHK